MNPDPNRRKALLLWLAILFAFIAAMIGLGLLADHCNPDPQSNVPYWEKEGR